MLYEVSPQFVSTDPMLPDLSMSSGSPVINKGSNAVVDSFGILTDYLGNPRIQQDTVDMGAYEFDSTINISEPFFRETSFLLQVRPNLLSVGESIQLGIFNLAEQKNFTLQMLSTNGQEHYRQVLENIAPQIPALYSISTKNLPAGMYLLWVEDGRGLRKTEKIILK